MIQSFLECRMPFLFCINDGKPFNTIAVLLPNVQVSWINPPSGEQSPNQEDGPVQSSLWILNPRCSGGHSPHHRLTRAETGLASDLEGITETGLDGRDAAGRLAGVWPREGLAPATRMSGDPNTLHLRRWPHSPTERPQRDPELSLG